MHSDHSTDYDIVIRNGQVLDGSGGEPFVADVAIRGDRIVAVGEVPGRGREEIDATGRMVTPGFVDIHTHYDGQVTWGERLSPSSEHGVTTVLMGNCGVGFAPCKPEHRDLLVHVMEGVEDIPEVVMADGLPWNWETFPDYLDALDARHADIDFAAQLAHSPLRVYVMGERGAGGHAPTEDELARMSELVEEAVRAGALGVTTSRSLGHRTSAGDLAPSVESGDPELIALASGLKRAGSGVFQMIPAAVAGSAQPADEMVLMRQLVEASGGRPLSYTLLNSGHMPDLHRDFLTHMERARADGLPIRGQVFPRPVGILLGLDLSFHAFRFHPSYRAIEHLPLAERVAAMRDPALRARLLAEEPEHSNPIFLYFVSQVEALFELGTPPNYEPDPAQSIGARAERQGIPARELLYDLLLQDEGRNILLLPAANYLGESLDAVHELLGHPDTLVGLGDGGAHYGMICDGSYSTTLLAYWTRDREGARVPLPWAIHALTRRNAEAIGLTDRGLIAPGLKADINIIDYERLHLERPHMIEDLPAGGRRLTQGAQGYEMTLVSGVITYRNGEHTGALPGRLVRNPQRAAG